MPIYRGPGGILIHDGKEYRIGDNVPMSKASVDHHRRYAGMLFDEDDASSITPPAANATTEDHPAVTAEVEPPTPAKVAAAQDEAVDAAEERTLTGTRRTR